MTKYSFVSSTFLVKAHHRATSSATSSTTMTTDSASLWALDRPVAIRLLSWPERTGWRNDVSK